MIQDKEVIGLVNKGTKGLFLLSFLDLATHSFLDKKSMYELADKIRPLIKDLNCDIIIVDKPVLPIHKGNFKKYLKSLSDAVDKLDED